MTNDKMIDSESKRSSKTVKTTSRVARKKVKIEKKEKATNKTFWVQIRMIPIWLRIILVALILVGAIALGVTIGYGYLGDGDPADALKIETWTHILDIINGKES